MVSKYDADALPKKILYKGWLEGVGEDLHGQLNECCRRYSSEEELVMERLNQPSMLLRSSKKIVAEPAKHLEIFEAEESS